jgi:hypothetical protein
MPDSFRFGTHNIRQYYYYIYVLVISVEFPPSKQKKVAVEVARLLTSSWLSLRRLIHQLELENEKLSKKIVCRNERFPTIPALSIGGW